MRTDRRHPASRLLILAFAALLLPSALAGQARNEIPRGDGQQVARPEAAQKAIDQLRSPYCPTMLEVCSSAQGAALRDSIVDLAEEGWTTRELVDWVVANHGEEYRALPRAEGKELVAWLVPPIGVALGVVALTLALKGMIRPSGPEEELPALADGTLSDDEEARLREAMRELDEEEEATFF